MSLETFFRGRLDAAARMGEVQRAFDERLPNLFVPNVQPGEPAALRPFQLRDDPPTRSLALSFNQATFVAFDYPGSDAFIEEATGVLSRTLEILGVEDLARVAYRYDNAYDLPKSGSGELPLDAILDVSFPAWLGSSGFRELGLDWTRAWERGVLMGRLFQEQHEAHATLRALLGAVVEPAGAVSGLGGFARIAHERALAMFEDMITEQFREFLAMAPGLEGTDG